MTSGMLDSVPVFLSRIAAAGLSEALIERMTASGIDTLAKLAFLSPVAANTGDDTQLMTELSDCLGFDEHNPMDAVTKSILRRTWFEAHATAISEVKNRVERVDDAAPRRLPQPEREDRRIKQQSRLLGIKIEGIHEPSHSLVDMVHTMKEDEQVRYISPEHCTHRDAELGNIKKETFLQSTSDGKLKQVHRDIPVEADVCNVYKLRLALQRRSLALDQMALMEFQFSEDYHERLFDLLQQPVPQGYAMVSVQQILQADKLVWHFMSSHCRKGISMRPDGSKPMELALTDAMKSPIITSALQPLPKLPEQRKGTGKRGDYSQVSTENYQRTNPYDTKGRGKGKKGAKGKNKGKPRKPFGALEGGKATTAKGDNICYGYNLGTCPHTNTKRGGTCAKGMHVCCFCDSPDHVFGSCPSKGS